MSAPTESRAQHLEWCKKRALQYCDANDPEQALSSMGADLSKHPETAGYIAVGLGLMLMAAGHLSTPAKMKEFIEGFN